LLHEAIGHGLKATSTARAPAFQAVSASVAAKGVTVLDDGTIADRRGSLNVDDEGNASQRNVLIEDGILKGYIQDRSTRVFQASSPQATGAAKAPTRPCRA
jgi:TldD protein